MSKPTATEAFDDANVSAAFEAIEREFHEVLGEMADNQTLMRFKTEYTRLHQALQKSHTNEKRLVKRVQDLNREILDNVGKVESALKLSYDDQRTISTLKKEIEQAWKIVDVSNEKERQAKAVMASLREEIQKLTALVERGAGLTVGQEHSVKELMAKRDVLQRECETRMGQIVGLRAEVAKLKNELVGSREETRESEARVVSLREYISTKNAESLNVQRRKERLDKELRDLQALLLQKQQELKEKQQTIVHHDERRQGLEQELQRAAQDRERHERDLQAQQQRTDKLSKDLQEQIQANAALIADNSRKQVELKTKEEQITRIRQEAQQVQRIREGLAKRVKTLEEQKLQSEKQCDALQSEITSLERLNEAARRQSEIDRKLADDLQRQRDVLNKNLLSATDSTTRQKDLVRAAENTQKRLEAEIASYKREAQRQRRRIHDLGKEKEKYGQQASEATSKFMHAEEQTKAREMQITELQKKVAVVEQRLKSQQNLYENVRSDRNLYSKKLIESQDSISEYKRKFKIVSHQIEQLKEEIATKDAALVTEHYDSVRVNKERDALKSELHRLREQVKMSEQTIKTQRTEIQNLNHVINEADAERIRQKKEYDEVINERDILGAQLIRRNDELAILYEKIKVLQSLLNKGEVQYRSRLEDIRLLRININDLKHELTLYKGKQVTVDGLRTTLYRLQKELLEERTKVKALSEELEKPVNIHRWRKLEGSDPSTYEMIEKIQTLQRRLIVKTEECVEKDLLIQEKEKMYMELKAILARQPGPEVAEQLNLYQQSLKDRTQRLRSVTAEMNMYQSQVHEHQFEIERLKKEMQRFRRRYYELQKKERIRNERLAARQLSRAAVDGFGMATAPHGMVSPATNPMGGQPTPEQQLMTMPAGGAVH